MGEENNKYITKTTNWYVGVVYNLTHDIKQAFLSGHFVINIFIDWKWVYKSSRPYAQIVRLLDSAATHDSFHNVVTENYGIP